MDPNRAMSQYVHDRWGADQGFPAGPVYAITQGTDGYLWIATEAGLVRFDGWNFRLIKDDSLAFTLEGILGVIADKEGCLWMRVRDLSLVRYCHGTFDRPSAKDQMFTHIEVLSRTNQGDFLLWKSKDGGFSVHNGVPRRLVSFVDLPPSPVTSMAQMNNGDVYMGTRDAGLFWNTGGRNISIRRGLPDLKINCLESDRDQSLWIGTDKGIVRWNGKEITGSGIPASSSRFQVSALVQDRDGNLWVGTDSRGLLRLKPDGLSFLEDVDNISGDAITALFEDREGNLWIGHAGGIERMRDSAFVTFSTPEGLPAEGSSPVFVDAKDRMWFSPLKGGLWWASGKQHGHVANDGLDRDIVYSLAGGPDELWIGRQRGGLTRLRYDDTSFEVKTYTHLDGLAQDNVYSVYRARDGTVWAGTLSGGLSALRNGQFTNYRAENGLASNTVASILESSDGAMWFATPGGLSVLAEGRWRSYGTAEGLPSQNVNCVFQDSAGVIWAGTASGIAFQGFVGFQVPSSPPDNALRGHILGLAEDKSGWLWVATSNHILHVNREKLLKGNLSEEDVREYGVADGLRGVEGVKRHQSVLADKSGRIWFSLNRGISVVDPARLTRNSAPAIAHVESISVDGQPVGLSREVHIPGGRQRITFGYSGISLAVPDRVRYRYMLEGFDRDWSGPVATREAVYTNLGPRTYRFRVVASNPDGAWSANEALTAFAVDPLFWQTWWFRVAFVVTCAAIILTFYRIRMQKLAGQLSLRFEERLAERTRIAQELHDTLLQGFLSASMQLHVAAELVPEDSPAKPILSRSLELMRQVIDEGRNAVRGLRSSTSSSLDLERVFSRIPEEIMPQTSAAEQVGFRVIVEGEQKPLHPLLRDDIYKIGREALINAFRHGQAKNIEIELNYSPSQLKVLVRDDGRGIEPEILKSGRDGHWGLSGMRERAEQIGARLHVYSSAVAGTEVELSIPGHIAYRDHSSRRTPWFNRRNPPGANGGPATVNPN